MATVAEIKAKYQKQHDELSKAFYQKKHTVGVTPEEEAEFKAQHDQIWADMEAELKTADDYVAPPQPRDLEAEIDQLKAEIKAIRTKIGLVEVK